MVELGAQYQRLKVELDQAIFTVLGSTQFIKGPQVSTFENNLAHYLHCKYVIACANGTDALQIAMMALGLQPGDEVITASFTYVATAEVIALLRLTPVLVDVHPDTFTIDPAAIEAAITPKTKAIVPVHLFGQCADMEPILNIAAKHNLYVIEDNAQAIGAEYTFSNGSKKKSGTMGTVGTTSFFPSKNLGCFGDGGAVNTDNEELASKIRKIANHGQSVQYVHDEIGVNSRLDTLQAAVLQVKLKYLDDFAARRNRVADFYDNAFAELTGVKVPVRAPYSSHVFHQYTLQLSGIQRDEVRTKLAGVGIPSMIYYPIPLHHQKAYESAINPSSSFPVTETLCNSVLSLPMHTEFEQQELNFIVKSFISIFNSKGS
ncbi:MAG: DegT/DnrJ/EryC1/StrS family aminotransferase [Bacteroidetes bacterium]|nr:DegT/DnrJ/EryC1/StrS family aminotransferase [Bacteroidota bacterium]